MDAENDDRNFVKQLRAVGVGSDRLKRAMLDYYRAFQQRSSWTRKNVVISGEIESYDNRLIDEWARLKEIAWDELQVDATEDELQRYGRELLNQLSTRDSQNLRIRSQVTATFVAMGSYHILANEREPSVYWHPKFIERVNDILR